MERDEVAAVLAVGLLDGGLGAAPGRRRARWRSRGQLGLELQHLLHAGQVEALAGELLDAAQLLDVLVAVAAAAAAGAGRVDQALALVDAQGLRVQPGQLGGHRDHVDGSRWSARWSAIRPPGARGARPRSTRLGRPRAPCARRSTSLAGTATSTVTSRSPVPLRRGDALALHPERAARAGAGRDPQRHRRPSRVGTAMSAPRAASGKVIGHGEREVVALARRRAGGRPTRTTT